MSELIWLATAIVIGGIVTGVLAGLFGIGGGAIVVPVLYEVFGVLGVLDEVRMQLCVGTSLAIIAPTTVRSYLVHRERGAVLPEVMRAWTLPALVGVGVGSVAAAFAPGAVFKVAFVIVAGVTAFKLLVGRESWRFGDKLPGGIALRFYGFLVGLSSALMGVSGGSISNMVQTLYGIPIHNAVATSAGLGVPITIAGTVGYVIAGLRYQALLPPLSIGFVSLAGLALMAPISSYMASYGARLAHALPRRRLEIGFGLFLLVVSARFVVSLIG